MRVGELRLYHIQDWADSYEFSKTSRRNYLRAVKRALTWATKQGYIDRSPLEHLERATRKSVLANNLSGGALKFEMAAPPR